MADVLRLTAPSGGDKMEVAESWRPPLEDIRNFNGETLHVYGCDMPTLARILELRFNRPVLDETHLDGRFNLFWRGGDPSMDTTIRLLKERFGIVLSGDKRVVEMILISEK
jgi:hypothetical protein